MDKFWHSVRLDESLCEGCFNCIKHCPTQAIRVRNKKARINSEFCIDCGECIRICPHHAKIAQTDTLEHALGDRKYNVVMPAPSLYGQFNNLDDVNIVLNALKHMGFDDVYEVGAAAEIVSELSREYIASHPKQYPLISTACPSIVRLIRVRFPNLIDHLMPLLPPIEVAAKLAVKKAMQDSGLSREEIGITFITPCPSKVAYVNSPLGLEKSNVDYAVAIKDVYPILLPHMKAVNQQKDMEDIVISGKIGVSWGRSGGEAGGLFTDDYLAADGIRNVIRVLEDMEDEKLENLKFVELNACDGGCVGGVLQVENPYVAAVKLMRLRKYMPVARAHADNAEARAAVPWERHVDYEPVYNLGNSMMESFSRLNQVERLLKKLPGLDCGSCGAPTCRCLAEDIVRGQATETDCVYYLKENLHKLSQEVATLSEDIGKEKNGEETLCMLRQYMERIREEMSELDNKEAESKHNDSTRPD